MTTQEVLCCISTDSYLGIDTQKVGKASGLNLGKIFQGCKVTSLPDYNLLETPERAKLSMLRGSSPFSTDLH